VENFYKIFQKVFVNLAKNAINQNKVHVTNVMKHFICRLQHRFVAQRRPTEEAR